MNGQLTAAAESGEIQPISMTEKLANEEARLTRRLEKIREVRQLLDANPSMQTVIDGLTELGQYHY